MHLLLPRRSVAYRAIIFDKDGTLVDLNSTLLALGHARMQSMAEIAGPAAARAWQQAVGADLSRERIDPDGPLSLAPRRDEQLVAASALYRLGHPWDEARALAQAAYDRADELIQPPYGARLLPGIAAMLQLLHTQGALLAIATTDRRWRAERSLAALGLQSLFSAIVGAEDVANGKPAPEMVFLACERLGCRPDETVMVGDSPTDLKMGHSAGCAACIGVTSGLNPAEKLEPLADLVLPSAAELVRYQPGR